MRIKTLPALGATVLLAAWGGGSAPAAAPAAHARTFSSTVDNPWYPLKPGTVYRYRGAEGKQPITDVLTVTRRTRRIAGVDCVVVRDKVFKSGYLAEDTTDWFAQDSQGTVWYFGEATRELDRKGHTTSTEGSWRAGVKGARQGVIMPAHPRVGDSFVQEHFKGHAEDHFKILSKRASISVPYGSYHRSALRTREWTPLEPGVIDNKYYARGIGQVEERTVKGGREFGRLVSIAHR
jgi:hypothetical protein